MGAKGVLLSVPLLALGIAAGIGLERSGSLVLLSQFGHGSHGAPAVAFAVEGSAREILYYRHPHSPSITSDRPMKDEMGMDYIPIYADAGEDGGAGIRISPTVINNLGVRTEKVLREDLWRRIETVGYIDYDERRKSHVHLRTEGWIERLRVRALGEQVRRGDLLFEVYSPQLVNAQEEYLQTLGIGNQRITGASRERLLALGIPESQVRELEEQRRVRQLTSIYARQDGVVSELDIREGMYVAPAANVMTIADLSSVWVLVDVFERQAAWVSVGQKVEVHVPYLPDQQWEGTVDYVYPDLDPRTRTLRVRLRFDNPGAQLKPNMFVKASILTTPRQQALSLPREALIRTGTEARVVLDRGEGRFEPVAVRVGLESGERVEVLDGLDEGDRVVVSAQFLIDSEASLRASFRRISEPEAQPDAGDVVWAEGLVREIRPDEQVLNVSHDPVPALGWPAMTMDLRVADDVGLTGFGAGDQVRFAIRQTGELEFLVTALEPHGAHFEALGVVHGVAHADRTVDISHEPILALGWPAMRMDLRVAEDVALEALAPETAVQFTLYRQDPVTYLITAITPVEP
jgi:membrane fusion protein, copper/silver efflux system